LFVCFAVLHNARIEKEQMIRVLVASPMRALREMLYDTIREEPDIEVIGEVPDEEGILPAAERAKPDCLIVPLGEPASPAPVYSEILAHDPQMRILALGEGSDVAALYWMSEDTREVRCTYIPSSREKLLWALRFSPS